MEHLKIEQQIRSEIYRAFELLGAGRELLCTIGSWGDTLSDEEVLTLLKEWNAEQARREKLASNCSEVESHPVTGVRLRHWKMHCSHLSQLAERSQRPTPR